MIEPRNSESAVDVVQVAAGAGASFAARAVPVCGMIIVHAAGVVRWTNSVGTLMPAMTLPAGSYPIFAQGIHTDTAVVVTCLFFAGDA